MQISLEKVSFSYSPGTPVLQDISLTVQPGERVAILGRNGCGKTTLVRHLNGLLRPEQGHVWIGSWNTRDYPVAKLARRVALLFQNPDDQLFMRRVWDDVAFGAENLGCCAEEVNRRVTRALDWFSLTEAGESNPYDLGYSQRKCVAIASIVAMDTPILVFDEPTAGLAGDELHLFIRVLHYLSTAGKTILTISHDMDFVAEQFPRIVCLNRGRVAFDGTAADAFRDTALLAACGLEMPQAARLSAYFQQPHLALTPEQFLAAPLAGRRSSHSGSQILMEP